MVVAIADSVYIGQRRHTHTHTHTHREREREREARERARERTRERERGELYEFLEVDTIMLGADVTTALQKTFLLLLYQRSGVALRVFVHCIYCE